MPERLLSARETAAALGARPDTVRHWAACGRLTSHRDTAGWHRVPARQIARIYHQRAMYRRMTWWRKARQT